MDDANSTLIFIKDQPHSLTGASTPYLYGKATRDLDLVPLLGFQNLKLTANHKVFDALAIRRHVWSHDMRVQIG